MILTSNSTKSRRHGKLVNLELVAQTIKRLRDQIYFVCVVNLVMKEMWPSVQPAALQPAVQLAVSQLCRYVS